MSEPGIAPTIDIPDNGSYAMVAQACAIAIQDAVAYLRNTETVATSAIGVAQDLILRTGNPEPGADIIKAAQDTIAAAVSNLDRVGAAVAKILRDFPQR